MVFGITNAQGYREKVEADLTRFLAKIDSADLAINAFTSTYHLHEWLWAHLIKPMNPRTVRGTTFVRKNDFVRWLDEQCPNFSLVQDMTNGSKHALPVHSGGPVQGYGQGPYGIGPFGMAYLLIDLGAGTGTDRYKVASMIVSDAAHFMVGLAKELGA